MFNKVELQSIGYNSQRERAKMLDLQIINHPSHYIKNRTIQPISIIEHWSLCHHLACVVKYIARYGRKENALMDLCKAEWYLQRELTRYQKQFNKCYLALIDPYPVSVDAVLDDWKLPKNLEEVLLYITAAKAGEMKQETLGKALSFLQQEIQEHEKCRSHYSTIFQRN